LKEKLDHAIIQFQYLVSSQFRQYIELILSIVKHELRSHTKNILYTQSDTTVPLCGHNTLCDELLNNLTKSVVYLPDIFTQEDLAKFIRTEDKPKSVYKIMAKELIENLLQMFKDELWPKYKHKLCVRILEMVDEKFETFYQKMMNNIREDRKLAQTQLKTESKILEEHSHHIEHTIQELETLLTENKSREQLEKKSKTRVVNL